MTEKRAKDDRKKENEIRQERERKTTEKRTGERVENAMQEVIKSVRRSKVFVKWGVRKIKMSGLRNRKQKKIKEERKSTQM